MKVVDFEPKFDWYQATFDQPPGYLIDALRSHKSFGEVEGCRPQNGYRMADRIVGLDGESLATIHYGGNNSKDGRPNTHLIASSGTSDECAALLRSEFPSHLVTRCDVCVDLIKPDLFNECLPVLLAIAKNCGVRPFRQGDWDSDSMARTLMLGSPTSGVRHRIYEKGMEQFEKGILTQDPNQDLFFSESSRSSPGYEKNESDGIYRLRDWVRFELQLRVKGEDSRSLVARLPADQIWGCSPTSRLIVEAIGGPKLKAISVNEKRVSSLERSYMYGVNQYGQTFRELAQKRGRREFMRQLELDIFGETL
jgi:hypothetical protein